MGGYRKLILGIAYMACVTAQGILAITTGLGAAGITAVASLAVGLATGVGVVVYGYQKEAQHAASIEVAKAQNGKSATNGGS